MEERGRQQKRAKGDVELLSGPKRASAYASGVLKLEWLFRDVLRWAKMSMITYT